MKKGNQTFSAIRRMCLKAGLVVLLYAGVFVLGATISWAYSYPGYHWNATSVSYMLDSATLTSSYRTAIKSSEATWDAAGSGSAFRFNYLNTYNSTTTCPGYPYVYAANVGNTGYNAMTSTTIGSSSHITWVYTYLNTYYSYSVGGSSTTLDVQDTATHEFGHWLYLGDLTSTGSPSYCSSSSRSTMCQSTYYGYTYRRSLATDDKNGISYIY